MGKRFFKKIVLVLLVFSLFFTFVCCTYPEGRRTGFDNISSQTSEAGLCGRLFPQETGESYYTSFAQKFENIDKNGCYYTNGDPFNQKELVLMYIQFTEYSYDDAKQFIFDNMSDLSKDVFTQSGDYVFYKNEFNSGFYDLFVAFNDKTQTVVSFGTVLWGNHSEQRELVTTDFNAYLQLFSEYYDFSK